MTRTLELFAVSADSLTTTASLFSAKTVLSGSTQSVLGLANLTSQTSIFASSVVRGQWTRREQQRSSGGGMEPSNARGKSPLPGGKPVWAGRGNSLDLGAEYRNQALRISSHPLPPIQSPRITPSQRHPILAPVTARPPPPRLLNRTLMEKNPRMAPAITPTPLSKRTKELSVRIPMPSHPIHRQRPQETFTITTTTLNKKPQGYRPTPTPG